MMPKSIPLRDRYFRFVVIPDDPDACWGWNGGIDNKGYARISAGGTRGASLFAHRVSYEIHVGPIPEGKHVLHDCPGGDLPKCSNPRHLWIGTHTDNMADKERKGRGNHHGPNNPASGDRSGARLHPERLARGEKAGRVKLSDEKVAEIRARYAAGGISMAKLAAEYGVVPSTIFVIIDRRNWTHLP